MSSSSGSSSSGSDKSEELIEEEVVEEEVVEEEVVVEDASDEEEVEEEIIEDEVVDEEVIESDDGDVQDSDDGDVQDSDDGDAQDSDDGDVQDMEDVDLEGGDVENQAADRGAGETIVKARKPSKSPCWYWLSCLFVLGLFGGGGYFGYYLAEEENEGNEPEALFTPTAAPGPTDAPTTAIGTKFDDVVGECTNLDDFPNPIDQCNCFGAINQIPSDVQDRYRAHLFNFIPTLYPEFNDAMNSCTARNQALVWLSSGNNSEFTLQQKQERYALATVYAALTGLQWTRSTNWLSEKSVCLWSGVDCNEDETVKVLDVQGNKARGVVSNSLGL